MTENKKIYESPSINLIETEDEDVIATSPIELPVIPASYQISELFDL